MAQEMTAAQRSALQSDLAVVQRLLALESVSKHETRFENEVALVAPTSEREAIDAIVEEFMPPAVKPAGSPVSLDFDGKDLLEAMGGVRGNQTLYVKELGDGLRVYVAYWPWGNGKRFTIKIGVYADN